jgi:cytoskeletal protein RodZ
MSTNPSHRSQSPIPGTPGSPTYAQMAGSPPPSPSAVSSKRLHKPTKRFDGTYAPPIKKTKTADDASAPIPVNSTPAPAPTAVSAPTRAKPACARPTAPANNSGDESSGGSDSESSEAAFLPGSGEDKDGASSGSDVDVILSGDDSVIEVSAPDHPKEKSKGKKKRLKGRKSKGKAKVQL